MALSSDCERPTIQAFVCMRLLGLPCWSLLMMLVFILYKYLDLSAFQVTTIIALKPTSSLLSPYWNQAIYKRPDRLLKNLVWANILRHLPFLFVPWVTSPWYIIAAFGLYMTLSRATIPAWMELFRLNLPHKKPEKIVGYGTTIDYCGIALLSFAMGYTLDHYPSTWRYLFAITAFVALLATSFLSFVSLNKEAVATAKTNTECNRLPIKLWSLIVKPFARVWHLLRSRPDFALFQVGFMLGGAGLMIMQPALPAFFVDTLNLSFVELSLAIALCKGVGVLVTSPLWARLFQKRSLFLFCSLVTLFASFFPFLILGSTWHIFLIYFAYLVYGVMQAGSEMSWHMSGIVFSKKDESTTFSVTNILAVGVRGCLIPFLGAWLLPHVHPEGVLLIGALMCLGASVHFIFVDRSMRQSVSV